MSSLPSPLKSPESITCQDGPGLGPTTAPQMRLVPFSSQTAAWPLSCCQRKSLRPSLLKSPSPCKCQARADVGPDRPTRHEAGPVEQPDRGLAAVVLPEEIGLVDAVEVPHRAQVEGGIRKLEELDVAQVIDAIWRTRAQIVDLPTGRAVGILASADTAGASRCREPRRHPRRRRSCRKTVRLSCLSGRPASPSQLVAWELPISRRFAAADPGLDDRVAGDGDVVDLAVGAAERSRLEIDPAGVDQPDRSSVLFSPPSQIVTTGFWLSVKSK